MESLNNFTSRSQNHNSVYYKKTLKNLLNKLFHQGDEDDEEIDMIDKSENDKLTDAKSNSLLNQMKSKLFERDPSYADHKNVSF